MSDIHDETAEAIMRAISDYAPFCSKACAGELAADLRKIAEKHKPSPPKPWHKCIHCDNESNVFCSACDSHICEDCLEKHHKTYHRDNSNRKPIPAPPTPPTNETTTRGERPTVTIEELVQCWVNYHGWVPIVKSPEVIR